eukprot:SAG22_NODE_618_length_8527_cov_6.070123_5_plen_110_part_00
MADFAEEWMKSQPQGDANPNCPLWLSLPWCTLEAEAPLEDADEKRQLGGGLLPADAADAAAEADAEAEAEAVAAMLAPVAAPRLLISYPEADDRVEQLRLESLTYARCC